MPYNNTVVRLFQTISAFYDVTTAQGVNMDQKKEDARIRRTKQKLFLTFYALLSESDYQSITVNEICERADIRRATFYKHYASKDDFAKYFVITLREQFDKRKWKKSEPGASSEYYIEYLREIVSFFSKNSIIATRVLESPELWTIIDIVMAQNYDDTCDRLRKSVSDGMRLPSSVETVASFLTGGLMHCILNWLRQGKPISENELIKEVSRVIVAMQDNSK